MLLKKSGASLLKNLISWAFMILPFISYLFPFVFLRFARLFLWAFICSLSSFLIQILFSASSSDRSYQHSIFSSSYDTFALHLRVYVSFISSQQCSTQLILSLLLFFREIPFLLLLFTELYFFLNPMNALKLLLFVCWSSEQIRDSMVREAHLRRLTTYTAMLLSFLGCVTFQHFTVSYVQSPVFFHHCCIHVDQFFKSSLFFLSCRNLVPSCSSDFFKQLFLYFYFSFSLCLFLSLQKSGF